jgi:hypothetical protein
MGISNFDDLFRHIGHKIVCVAYGNQDSDYNSDITNARLTSVWNVAVECETCGEVLMDFNHPDIAQEDS